MKRGQQVVELAIQLFVLSTICYGWYIATFHIGYWLMLRRAFWLSGGIYIATMNILLLGVTVLYLHLCSGRTTHSVPRLPIPNKSNLTEPYESINLTGDLAICGRGGCGGSWKPPTTHHCSTCGVCRIGFDHHCPWLGNCVAKPRLKAFLSLLCLTCTVVIFGVAPITDVLWRHIVLAYKVSRSDAWANRMWWNWFGSWIFCGGPFGRWIWGTVLGFRILKANRSSRNEDLPGLVVEQPHLRLFVVVLVAVLLSIFALVLVLMTIRSILLGTTYLESSVLQTVTGRPSARIAPKRFVFIPALCYDVNKRIRGEAYLVQSNERLYDQGKRKNWLLFLDMPLFMQDGVVYKWPKLNPAVLKRIRMLDVNANVKHDTNKIQRH